MLRTRLSLGLLPLLLLLIAVGGYALHTCLKLSRAVEVTLVGNYRAMLATEEMKDAATRLNSALDLAQQGDTLAALRRLDEQQSRFERDLHAQSMASAGTPRANPVRAVDRAFAAQLTLDKGLVRNPSGDLATLRATEGALFNTLNSLDALGQYDHLALESELASARSTTRTTVRLLVSAMGAAVLLSFAISFLLSRSLLRPIKALTSSAVALGDGDLDRAVPVLSRDELGDLARAFNQMAAKLRAFREATTEKVVRAQRTLEATLTSSPDPVIVVSAESGVEFRNPAAEALAGQREFAGGLPPELQEPLAEVLATGNHYLPTGYDRLITLHVGREDRYFLPRILAVGDTLTGFGGAAVLLQDVTKFRLLDNAKNNLVGTVSHELRTPLTGLRMAIYLLLEQNVGRLSSAQQELLETARDDAERLLRILNDLLDLSRLESGVVALSRVPTGADDLMSKAAAEMKTQRDAANQRLVIEIPPGIPLVPVDHDRIRYVFINLLANASKYSPEGSTISLYAASTADGFVKFGVRDEGPGIPSESVGRVFEKFFRVPGQTRKGAGLGLALAREIVVAHGGSIACSSTPGAGSDFYFLLPASAPAAE